MKFIFLAGETRDIEPPELGKDPPDPLRPKLLLRLDEAGFPLWEAVPRVEYIEYRFTLHTFGLAGGGSISRYIEDRLE